MLVNHYNLIKRHEFCDCKSATPMKSESIEFFNKRITRPSKESKAR